MSHVRLVTLGAVIICWDNLTKPYFIRKCVWRSPKQIGDKEGQGRSYHNLGKCYLSLRQHQKAELYLIESLRCYDELFGNVPKLDDFKIVNRETFEDTYMLLIIALLLQNKTYEALVIAKRSRSRALAELLLAKYSVWWTETLRTEVQKLELRDIREVIKALESVVLFLMLHDAGICAWVLKPNGNVQFKNMRVSLTSNTRDLLTSR